MREQRKSSVIDSREIFAKSEGSNIGQATNRYQMGKVKAGVRDGQREELSTPDWVGSPSAVSNHLPSWAMGTGIMSPGPPLA